MKSHRLAMPLLTLLLLTAFGSSAQAAVAVLERLAGNPTIYEVGASGARTVSLPRQGAEYTLPIEIETGPSDSATFRLPDSEVSVAPNTVMRVAAPESRGKSLMQRIFQKAGSSLFSVDRQSVEHFQVETPYLVSVVKGTTFNVVVHDQGATVSLHEGRLQVTSVDGGQRVDLRPGDVAFSGRDGALRKIEHTVAQRQSAEELNAAAGSDDELEAIEAPAIGDMLALQGGVGTELGDPLAVEESFSGTADALDQGTDDLVDVIDAAGGPLAGDLGASVDDIAEIGDDTGDLAGDIIDSTGGLVDDIGDTAGQIVGDLNPPDLVEPLVEDLTGDIIGDLDDLDLNDDLDDLADTGDLDLEDDLDDLGDDLDDLGGVLGL